MISDEMVEKAAASLAPDLWASEHNNNRVMLKERDKVRKKARVALEAAEALSTQLPGEPIGFVTYGAVQKQRPGTSALMSFRPIVGFTEPVFASPPVPVGGEVKVRPLEWRELSVDRGDGTSEPSGDWEADAVTGSYYLQLTDGRWSVERDDYTIIGLSRFSSPDEAKAAAQADYEARIRSALLPVSPVPLDAGLVERIVARVKPYTRATLFIEELREEIEEAIRQPATQPLLPISPIEANRSGQWSAFGQVLDYLNTLETKVIEKKAMYAAVMDMRPALPVSPDKRESDK